MKNGLVASYHNNQAHGDDAYLILEPGNDAVLDMILDGVSTGKGSAASGLMVETLQKATIKSVEDIATILKNVNKALWRKTSGFSLTTVTIGFKVGDQLNILNSGDSPAFLIRNGKIEELTVLDKVPGDLVTITNAVGIGQDFDFHLKKIQLKTGDKLILVTDGISDNVYPEELLDVCKEQTPEKAISALKRLTENRQVQNKGREDRFGHFKDDDLTAIIRYF